MVSGVRLFPIQIRPILSAIMLVTLLVILLAVLLATLLATLAILPLSS